MTPDSQARDRIVDLVEARPQIDRHSDVAGPE